MDTERSRNLFHRAQRRIPGGVNSPVRAFKAVGGHPRFIDRGEGAYMVDVDGHRYVDHVMSWGALILGHAHASVVADLTETLRAGTSFGAPCPAEVELAERICKAMPAVQKVRMVNSGTEAVMSALRVARAFTQRKKIVKFAGCYHGHADMLLVEAGSGVATLGLPDSPGVPEATVADTLVARYNDADSVRSILEAFPGEVAAVIVEPVAGNMGLVLPEEGFLEALRALTSEHNALLVFDEVMTGFRVGPGGAQGRFGITPDMTTLGKVIGGGLPVGAFGGRAEIMDLVAPEGPVYQAGTLSGNPLAMQAGLTTLRELDEPGVWSQLAASSEATVEVLNNSAREAGVPISVSSVGAMFGYFLTDDAITDWDSAAGLDRSLFARFYQVMLESGVYLAPSPFESGFVSTVHGDAEREILGAAADAAFQAVASE
ncbi:MAG TPA: glutamate-1-semialdehyde-2,1-aminomutase [Gemmatimonadetes bacterium]|nr:glutamate-1-semialdehyde-2,1-aminomutase [Gemmatimonadota bacterium]HIN52526.1 glutamate-1-semialdehyde-2,1-aminomutase [Gemmatimonadota bacterium]